MRSPTRNLSTPIRPLGSIPLTQLSSKAPEVLVNQVLLGLMAVALSQVLVLGEAFPEFREAAPGIGVSHAVRDEP